MCQSAVSVISSKEGRKSSSIKLLEEGESQMEEIATTLEAGLGSFFFFWHKILNLILMTNLILIYHLKLIVTYNCFILYVTLLMIAQK